MYSNGDNGVSTGLILASVAMHEGGASWSSESSINKIETLLSGATVLLGKSPLLCCPMLNADKAVMSKLIVVKEIVGLSSVYYSWPKSFINRNLL